MQHPKGGDTCGCWWSDRENQQSALAQPALRETTASLPAGLCRHLRSVVFRRAAGLRSPGCPAVQQI